MAVGHDHDLLPAESFRLLLDPGVQVSDHRLEAPHRLAVEVDDQSQHAVRGGVMWPEVDGQELAAERALLAGPGDRDALADRRGVAHAFSGGVCQVSCSSEKSTASPP